MFQFWESQRKNHEYRFCTLEKPSLWSIPNSTGRTTRLFEHVLFYISKKIKESLMSTITIMLISSIIVVKLMEVLLKIKQLRELCKFRFAVRIRIEIKRKPGLKCFVWSCTFDSDWSFCNVCFQKFFPCNYDFALVQIASGRSNRLNLLCDRKSACVFSFRNILRFMPMVIII